LYSRPRLILGVFLYIFLFLAALGFVLAMLSVLFASVFFFSDIRSYGFTLGQPQTVILLPTPAM
jgi:hypothetical protein